jgi:hypothetical protein
MVILVGRKNYLSHRGIMFFDDKDEYYKSIIEILCTKKSGFSSILSTHSKN